MKKLVRIMKCTGLFLGLIIFFTMEVQAQLNSFYSADTGKYGLKDNSGKVVVDARYELIYPFYEGRAACRENGKYGFIDERGAVLVRPQYEETWRFIGGYAAVKLNGKTGFVDLKGREVVAPIYEDGNNYHGACCYKGMAHVREHGKWKIIKLPVLSD